MAYQRVLLKLSGEALMGEQGYGIDPAIVNAIAKDVAAVVADGTQLAIVVGGGNIFRGLKGSAAGMDRATADYVGMLATVMNAITLQDGLERAGIPTRVQSAISMQEVAEPVGSFITCTSTFWRGSSSSVIPTVPFFRRSGPRSVT